MFSLLEPLAHLPRRGPEGESRRVRIAAHRFYGPRALMHSVVEVH